MIKTAICKLALVSAVSIQYNDRRNFGGERVREIQQDIPDSFAWHGWTLITSRKCDRPTDWWKANGRTSSKQRCTYAYICVHTTFNALWVSCSRASRSSTNRKKNNQRGVKTLLRTGRQGRPTKILRRFSRRLTTQREALSVRPPVRPKE